MSDFESFELADGIKNDIHRLAMESYDQGVSDALKASEETFSKALAAEREACARAAAIALLGADKSLADLVVNAIRSRGQRE